MSFTIYTTHRKPKKGCKHWRQTNWEYNYIFLLSLSPRLERNPATPLLYSISPVAPYENSSVIIIHIPKLLECTTGSDFSFCTNQKPSPSLFFQHTSIKCCFHWPPTPLISWWCLRCRVSTLRVDASLVMTA